MQQAEFENAEGVLPVLLVDDEIDAAILAAGFLPTATMPIERMRCLVADLSMAVANAVAIDDDAEFARATRGLSVLGTAEERQFAAGYQAYLIGEIRSQSFGRELDLASNAERFEQIKQLVCGARADL